MDKEAEAATRRHKYYMDAKKAAEAMGWTEAMSGTSMDVSPYVKEDFHIVDRKVEKVAAPAGGYKTRPSWEPYFTPIRSRITTKMLARMFGENMKETDSKINEFRRSLKILDIDSVITRANKHSWGGKFSVVYEITLTTFVEA